MAGKVYLTGAGPGDPELLTLKALRLLKRADVVLHDDLVSAAILQLVPAGVRVINVGKRCGRARIRQEEIEALMVAYARRGLTVVRLKGGDPLIFSRAGEEIEALRAAEVDFEVIPGITAAASAAAEAQMPLTHRRFSSTLVYLTGHPSAKNSTTAWPGLNALSGGPGTAAAAAPVTVAVYMPGTDYARLSEQLLKAGLAGDTPCLLVAGTGTPQSTTYRTTVADLGSAPELPSPRLLIAGGVAHLAEPASTRAAKAPAVNLKRAEPAGLVAPATR
jgi:uroporphyrin-III C-methyltransferase